MVSLNTKNIDAFLDLKNPDIENTIHEIWNTKEDTLWSSKPSRYIKLGETAYKLGQVMFAHDVLKEGLEIFPENLRITQLYSLSLIKCGFLGKARVHLSSLVKKGHHDEETLGILGRVYKDMGLISGEGEYVLRSRNVYLKAFQKNRGYYSGINAASLSYILGEKDLAVRLAKIVLRLCLNTLKQKENRSYWCLATVGEGFLILGNMKNAQKYFTLAKDTSTKNYADIASTKKQIKFLSDYIDIPEEIKNTLTVPTIIAFTGHMIDHPDRKTTRFPKEIAGRVKAVIASRLEYLNAGIGYSSAACGSDTLFLECMQERNAETNIILPYDLNDFYSSSVDFAGPEWRHRTEDVIRKAPVVFKATEGKYSGDNLLLEYANQIIIGKSLLRGQILETEPLLLAVWDHRKSRAAGGTFEFIKMWEAKGLIKEIIDINGLAKNFSGRKHREKRVGQKSPRERQKSVFQTGHIFKKKKEKMKREMKALLFADLVGYSTLKEEQFPSFYRDYLWALCENLKRSRYTPLYKNSWGDALYFVFDDLIAAAEYALELRDFVQVTHWEDTHLPGDLSIRIGLHAGPVYCAREPIMNRKNCFGTHVNRAARIEPITNPGNVYASEQFASLLMAHKKTDLECKYVGIIHLPKSFGSYPIYHIKRKKEIF
jgi:class 3 adenylate cyclase